MLDQLGNGLLLGIIISVASVALSLLYGVTRIVNFAHGEMIAVGGYTMVAASALALQNPFVIIVAAICVAMVASVTLESVGLSSQR